ncbi:MAG: 50S ribosomal protein L21 [Puniceicoccales bacterium]|jgi:large subunit ribosomal protein L21|nr:50S ribosomal protein L21 [Puniceicoccales bacterium]
MIPGDPLDVANLSMKAVLCVQGRQIHAQEGDVFELSRFSGYGVGDVVHLDKVLLLGEGSNAKIGTPYVDGASVSVRIMEHKRGKKILVIKRLRRKGFHRKRGHRQELSVVKIESIHG